MHFLSCSEDNEGSGLTFVAEKKKCNVCIDILHPIAAQKNLILRKKYRNNTELLRYFYPITAIFAYFCLSQSPQNANTRKSFLMIKIGYCDK